MANFSDMSYRKADVSTPWRSPARLVVHDWVLHPGGNFYACANCGGTTLTKVLFLDSTSGVPRVDCRVALLEEVMES